MGEIDCEHERTFTIVGKSDDKTTWSYNNGKRSSPDYAPEIEGLCGGDYIKLTVCLQCHVVIGFSSDDVDDLIFDLYDDEDEEQEELDEELEEDDDDNLDFNEDEEE